MLNWSDKLLDRVETALDRSGWLGKTADAVLAQLLPNDTAQAGCFQCACRDWPFGSKRTKTYAKVQSERKGHNFVRT